MLKQKIIGNYIEQLKEIHDSDTTELLKMAVRLPDALKVEKETLEEAEKEVVKSLFGQTLARVYQHRTDEAVVHYYLVAASKPSILS